jgi:hypothetical protein
MKKILIGFLMMMGPTLLLAGGQDDNFSEKLYSAVEISGLTKTKGAVDGLSESDKNELLSAKRNFSAFLENLQKGDPKALEFLSSDLREKYPSLQALFQEFEFESLLSYEIFDFNFIEKKKKIEFRYFLTDMTEGTICSTQKAITLGMQDKEWKISDFNKFSKF